MAGQYLRPFSECEVKNLIGPFQSSPLSLVTKPGKPGKCHGVHNFFYPHAPSSPIQSINSSINADDYPCAYGTFGTICLIIVCLPPSSQVSICDVAEAYRTIPIKPSQWPGLIIHLQDPDQFARQNHPIHDCNFNIKSKIYPMKDVLVYIYKLNCYNSIVKSVILLELKLFSFLSFHFWCLK